MQKDIRQYSVNELSDIVYNDEGLYNIRFDHDLLWRTLNELYLYTFSQRQELVNDIEDEKEEL